MKLLGKRSRKKEETFSPRKRFSKKKGGGGKKRGEEEREGGTEDVVLTFGRRFFKINKKATAPTAINRRQGEKDAFFDKFSGGTLKRGASRRL